MPRFTRHTSRHITRRIVSALALATTLALPALTIIAGQDPAGAAGGKKSTNTTVELPSPMGNKWR